MQKTTNSLNAKEELRQLILNNGLKWGEGMLKNGNVPKWIFDLREVILTPEGSRLASSLIYEKIKDIDFDAVGGPSIAAEPLTASLIMHFYNKERKVNGFIVRKQPNNFGLRKKVEGPVRRGDKVVLIDDALNSGNSKFDAIEALNREGLQVVKIVTLLDFFKSGHHRLKEEGYSVDYIFTPEDFGLEMNKTYNYRKLSPLTEIKKTDEKENVIRKINQVLDNEISDFKLHGNLILATFKDGSVFCFNQKDYSVKWSLELGESIPAPIFIDGDVALISASSGLKRSKLFFISVEKGNILKTINMSGMICSAPFLYENNYLLGSDDKKLYCIDKKTMKINWSFETDGAVNTNPAIDTITDTIYIGSADGYVYALDLSGKLQWKKHIGKIKSNPLLNGNKLIVSSDINVIFCLDKNNGNLFWFHELKNEANDLKISGSRLIAGCNQGYMLNLDLDTGRVLDASKLSNKNIKMIEIKENKLIVGLENGKSYTV